MYNAFIGFAKKFPDSNFRISFFGGEPFIERDAIESFVERANEYCKDNFRPVPKYQAITNGSLLDDETRQYIIKHFAGITTSLDGTKTINDSNRIYLNGEGTFDAVCSNISALRKQDIENKLTVVCEATLTKAYFDNYSKEIVRENYEFFKGLFDGIGLIPEESDRFDLTTYANELDLLVGDFMDLWIEDILNNRAPLKIISFNNIIAGFSGKQKGAAECAAGSQAKLIKNGVVTSYSASFVITESIDSFFDVQMVSDDLDFSPGYCMSNSGGLHVEHGAPTMSFKEINIKKGVMS